MPAAIEKGRLNREIWGVVIALTALLIGLSLISYNANDRSFNTPSGALNTHNWGGFVGAFLADVLLQGLGLASYLLPVFLCMVAIQMFRTNYQSIHLGKAVAYAILLVSIGVILSVVIDSESARDAGGIIGGFLKESVLGAAVRTSQHGANRMLCLAAIHHAANAKLPARYHRFHEKEPERA